MSLAEYAALAAAGGLAAESTGITDFTPIGSDDDEQQTPTVPVGGGGGIGRGIGDLLDRAELAAAIAGAGGGPTVIEQGGRTVERIREQVPVPVPTSGGDQDGGGFGGFDWPTGGGDRDDRGDRGGSGPGVSDRQRAAAASGRDPFGLQATGDGWLAKLGEIGRVGGKTANQTGRFGTEFAEENPYFTGAAGTGAALGSIIPGAGTAAGAATGAAVGGVAEVGADTITGGTPLGVQSPIDATSGGAWWQGADPLNLGPSDGSDDDEEQQTTPNDPAEPDQGTNREQDKNDGSGAWYDGPDPFNLGGSGGSGDEQPDGDELRGTRGADPADADSGTNREQDKEDDEEPLSGFTSGRPVPTGSGGAIGL